MPEKSKKYTRVRFTPAVIKEAEEVLRKTMPKGELQYHTYEIEFDNESWNHSTEEEFFADYSKGFVSARYWHRYENPTGSINVSVDYSSNTKVSVLLGNRSDIEKVFNVLERNVDKCRLPKQPKEKTAVATDWITGSVDNIETHRSIVARKIRLALGKLNSEDVEEWQNATMLIRDAWIELTQWLCEVKGIDTSDISRDAVVDRLKKLEIDKTDERLFNLARASFNLYGKHHKRDIELDTAVACVLSTIVSMKTVIKESFDATG